MTIAPDPGISLVNAALAVLVLVLTSALLLSLLRGPSTRMSRNVSRACLALFAISAVVASLGPVLVGGFAWSFVVVQIIVMSCRLTLALVLSAWVATVAHGALARRWPRLGVSIDRAIRLDDGHGDGGAA